MIVKHEASKTDKTVEYQVISVQGQGFVDMLVNLSLLLTKIIWTFCKNNFLFASFFRIERRRYLIHLPGCLKFKKLRRTQRFMLHYVWYYVAVIDKKKYIIDHLILYPSVWNFNNWFDTEALEYLIQIYVLPYPFLLYIMFR